MITFNASQMMMLAKEIGRLSEHFDRSRDTQMENSAGMHNSEAMKTHGDHLDELGLEVSAMQADRVKELLGSGIKYGTFSDALKDLHQRILDQAALLHFITLSREDCKYFDPKSPLFGNDGRISCLASLSMLLRLVSVRGLEGRQPPSFT